MKIFTEAPKEVKHGIILHTTQNYALKIFTHPSPLGVTNYCIVFIIPFSFAQGEQIILNKPKPNKQTPHFLAPVLSVLFPI